MTEKYCPSNGTDGDIFMSAWCFNGCTKHSEDNPCEIMGRSFCYGIDDPNYPEEWIYDEDGKPTCTAFSTLSEEKRYRCQDTEDMFKAEK